MLTHELDAALKQLIEQWNIAERRIKKAEQVRANEVVSSAIFELRYAGRKIIDAIHMCLHSDVASDHAANARVHAFIADATEDCVKAKHDAIDSMMDFVVIWFNDVERRLSLGKLQHFFPDYLDTTGLINGIQQRIAESRGDRTRLRDAIYDSIDGEEYERVLALFDKMRLSKDKVHAEIERERSQNWWLWFITIVSLIVGIVGAVFGLIPLL